MVFIETLIAVIFVCSKAVMILGGAFPYIPQYSQILETQDASGFSLYICLILIASNVLRIVYWFGIYFDLTLLIQSIVMIITMFIMLQLCVRMRPANYGSHTFWDFEPTYFWQYSDFSSYIYATLCMAIPPVLVMYFFGHLKEVVEAIGFLALGIESCLAIPQSIQNYQNQNTVGMSKMMLFGWAAGDAFKLIYALLTRAPWPFNMCATIQLIVDFIIFIQLIRYPDTNSRP